MSARPTPGPWFLPNQSGFDGVIGALESTGPNTSRIRTIARSVYGIENANLIIEAGTVYHETQLTPRELADQRAELLELAVQYRDDLRYPPSDDSRERRLKRVLAAIAKAGAA